mgnify:FL=1
MGKGAFDMQDFQKRVIEEKKELDIKIEKLDGFIRCNSTYKTLVQVGRMRLLEQLEAMRWYTRILGERIAAFLKTSGC